MVLYKLCRKKVEKAALCCSRNEGKWRKEIKNCVTEYRHRLADTALHQIYATKI